MEPVDPCHISHVKFTPDIDTDTVLLEAEFSGYMDEMYLEADISFQGDVICRDRYLVNNKSIFRRSIHLSRIIFSADPLTESSGCGVRKIPRSFDVTFRLVANGVCRYG